MGALFPQIIKENKTINLNQADGNVAKTLVTGGENGTKLYAISAYNNGSTPISVLVVVSSGGVAAILTKVEIPAEKSINLLDHIEVPSVMEDGSLLVGPLSLIQVYTATLPQPGDTVDIVAQLADY